MSTIEEQGFSATVELELHLADQVIQLAQVGPDQCILATPQPIQAGRGEIVVTIDGHVQRTVVELDEPTADDACLVPLRQIGNS